MPVPKRKRSRARRDSRFADKGIIVKQFTTCSNCNSTLNSHTACTQCGFYKGAKVLVTKKERSLKRSEVRLTQEARKKSQAADKGAEQAE